VEHLNATTNRKTRNAEQQIGTGEPSQTQHHPQNDGYGSRLDPPGGSGLGDLTGLEPNKTVFVVPSWNVGRLPAPVANPSLPYLDTS
jgi:hypothetical protein